MRHGLLKSFGINSRHKMTKQELAQACKDTVAYKAHESAIKASESAYRVKEAAQEAWGDSLLTKFETMWALGATPEYISMMEAQDD